MAVKIKNLIGLLDRLVQVFFGLFPSCTPEIHLSDFACQLTLMYGSTKKAAPLFLFVKKKNLLFIMRAPSPPPPKLDGAPAHHEG